MHETLKQRLIAAHQSQLTGCRRRTATAEELLVFEEAFGPIPADYRWYLGACGGGLVGVEWVDGIEELIETHRKFRAEAGPPYGWSMTGVFVIGWDRWGNPFGIHQETGKVLVEDHQLGGINVMARSFADLLVSGLLQEGTTAPL